MLLLGQLSAGVLAVGISTADYADPQPNIQQHWTVALVLGIVWFCFCGCSVLGDTLGDVLGDVVGGDLT